MRGKKSLSTLLSLGIAALGITANMGAYAAAADTGTAPVGKVTLSVEKFTLGQGYYLEPIQVPFYKGENGANLLLRAIGEGNLRYQGTAASGFYMTAVKDSTVEATIPAYIQSRMEEKPTAREAGDEWLGELDYSKMAGWLSVVNNVPPEVGPSDYHPQDGDVIRYQFSVYGYGSDITTSQWAEGYVPFADKDDLTALVASINSSSSKEEKLKKADVKSAYENAYSVLENLESTQASVDAAYNRLAPLVDWKKAFADAGSVSGWALSAVETAVDKGYLQGSEGKLNPQATITRAEFAKLLVNVLGLRLSASTSSSFKDVSKDKWYFSYVNTASEAGFISGYNGEFHPNDTITREQMASILVKALGLTGASAGLTFKDGQDISAWAKKDVEKAVAAKLLQGQGNLFNPQGEVTREMATVVALRAYESYPSSHPAA